MENHKLYLYPVWLRTWHGINALCIIVLIITGVSMQYGNLDYPVVSFKTSVLLHNAFGIIMTLSYLVFIVGNFVTDNGIHYRFKIRGLWIRIFKQAMYYMSGYFKDEPKPFPITEDSKFNPLQRTSYAIAMYILMPIIIITGIALLYPEFIFDQVLTYSGVQLTALLHAAIGFFISLFLIIHLYVASIGKNPIRNFKSIINGYHES